MAEEKPTPKEDFYTWHLREMYKDLASLRWYQFHQRRVLHKCVKTWRQDEHYRKLWVANGGNPETPRDRRYIP